MTKLKDGLPFPEYLMRTKRKTHEKCVPRKIGNNKLVLSATERIKDYCKYPLFIALVPTDNSTTNEFYHNTLKDYKADGFQEWDIKNWGYITWADVEDFCTTNRLNETLENFELNKGGIY